MTIPRGTALTKPWRRSSYCDTGGQCVEVAQARTSWLVRDSKDPNGARLAVRPNAWAAFICGIKHSARGRS